MLQYHFNWKTISRSRWDDLVDFYFRLFPGAIRSPQIIEFLSHLLRHIPGKLLIVWDGLPGLALALHPLLVELIRACGDLRCKIERLLG